MIKAAVVGVGTMGRNHARVYAELSDVELVAVADLRGDVANEIAGLYATKAYTDYQEMLAREKPHIVSIAVPTIHHCVVACDVIDYGANVLVEKPLAFNVHEAREIIRRAQQRGVKLTVGHIERFNPSVQVLRQALENEEIISINITRVGPLPPRIKDVGIVIDLASHDIDLIRYLCDSEIVEVYAVTSRALAEHEDTALLIFRVENGVLAHVTANWLTPFKAREIHVSTRNKFIRADLITQQVVEFSGYKADGSYTVKALDVPFGEPLRLELESFVKSIREDRPPPVAPYDGLRAIEIAWQCLRTGTRSRSNSPEGSTQDDAE